MSLSKVAAQFSPSAHLNLLAENASSTASCPNGRQCRTHPVPVIGDQEPFEDYKKRCAEWKEQHGLKFEATEGGIRNPSSYAYEKIGHWNSGFNDKVTQLYNSALPKIMDNYNESVNDLDNAAGSVKNFFSNAWQNHPTAVKVGIGVAAVAAVIGVAATAPVWGAALAGSALIGGIAWSASS